jgi:hypothetical protein
MFFKVRSKGVFRKGDFADITIKQVLAFPAFKVYFHFPPIAKGYYIGNLIVNQYLFKPFSWILTFLPVSWQWPVPPAAVNPPWCMPA